jgi:hypothetical protein
LDLIFAEQQRRNILPAGPLIVEIAAAPVARLWATQLRMDISETTPAQTPYPLAFGAQLGSG